MTTPLLRLGIALLACGGALAQSLVEPSRIPEIERTFNSVSESTPMRCRIDPERPAIDYALRFRTGYRFSAPMMQFSGSGHTLSTYVRVTPDGQKATYLETSGGLPAVPATNLEGQITGRFVVGEGGYDVEVLVEDETHRACHNRWHIQAKYLGSERELAPSTPPGAVEELPVQSSSLPPATEGAKRITILLHAAPSDLRTSTLQEDDVNKLAGSLYALLRQLPAQSVRVVAFSVAQRSVPFRQDDFTVDDLGKLIDAIEHLELAKVDYKTLQQAGSPVDMVTGLVQGELNEAQPPDAVILLGPPVPARETPLPGAAARTEPTSLFYLQFQRGRSVAQIAPPQGGGRGGRAGCGGCGDGPVAPIGSMGGTFPMPAGAYDVIEKLVARWKGKTFQIRAPHDLADSIRRIQVALPKSPLPARTAAPSNTAAPSSTAAPSTPAAASSTPAAHDAPNRPAAVDPAATEGPLDLSKVDKIPKVDPTLIDADPVELLMRVRDQVLEHAVEIPKHTCVETVERQRYEPVVGRSPKSCDNLLAARKQARFQTRLRLAITDRLRLDVAMAPDREIFSWAGAAKFEDSDIDELIPEGAIGTGSFASFLLTTFADRNSKFVYEGDTDDGTRKMLEYSFTVPRDESHYRVKAHKNWVITGYTGTLQVDAKTAELVKLTIRTDELPAETSVCETDSTLEYGTVQLGGDDYLLPTLTRQRFIGRDGSEDENSTTFAACRAFQTESTLSFGGPSETGRAEGAKIRPLDAPSDFPVTVELATPVNFDKSAAGDLIEGRLTKAIRDGQKTLVPAGALVHGRLMRVEIRYSSPFDYIVALRWETVEVNGAKVPLNLKPEHRPNIVSGLRGLRQRGMTIELPLPGEGGYGVYHSRTPILGAGLQTDWIIGRP